MVYQIKDTENERSTGFRCDQSGKDKIITLLNDIEIDDRFASKVTKDGAKELCVRQELTLRSFEKQKLEPGEKVKYILTFYLDPEIVNDLNTKNIEDVTLSYTFFPSDYYEPAKN